MRALIKYINNQRAMPQSVKSNREKSDNKMRFCAEIERDQRNKFRAIAGVRGVSMSEQLRRWIDRADDPRRTQAK
jgi:hypothetical protein